MMKIDGCPVVSDSAEYFRAIGGGWGIKMKLPKGRGDFLFGIVETEDHAKTAVLFLNGMADDAEIKSSLVRTKVKLEVTSVRAS